MNESTQPISGLPPMIDTHCHLDDHQFADDAAEVIEASRAANVTRWLLIAYHPDRWNDAIKFAGGIEGMRVAVGVHPACAELWSDDTAQRLRDTAAEVGALAIGEAGLDFYRDNAPFVVQAPAFIGQLEIARALDLPLIIHMRSAEDELVSLLRDQASLPKLIFHSFDGGSQLMDFVLETDSYVGIGGLATRQRSDDLREQLKRVPRERILLETDSPYLVPARQKDRRNQPRHVATIAQMMAEHFGTDPASFARETTENAERVFHWSSQ